MLGHMGREDMRAGDGDRQKVADQLKTALDEGRLDLSEYDERLQKTYAAKTYGDLSGLLDDLPGTVPVEHSQVQAYHAPAGPASTQPPSSAAHRAIAWAGPYGGLIAVCVIIWAISSFNAGHLTNFWPAWMLIPLVLGLAGSASGRGAGDRGNRKKRRNR
jgi:hypothetical protein